MRLAYPLGQRSIVFDLGRYHGGFAARIVERFEDNPKVHALPFGLSFVDGKFPISTATDGSSIVHQWPGLPPSEVRVDSFVDSVVEEGAGHTALLEFDIEDNGCEVPTHIKNGGLSDLLMNLRIRFSNFVEGHAANATSSAQINPEPTRRQRCAIHLWGRTGSSRECRLARKAERVRDVGRSLHWPCCCAASC